MYFGNSPVARFIKKFWAHFPNFCVSQQSCLPWSSDTFFELSASKVYKNVLGTFSRFWRAKTKLLAMKSILEVFTLQVKKKFWAHFLDFCIPKRKYLPWSSDAFWKFSACKFYRKRSGRNFTSCASKNEAVCCEVQTHFGSSLLSKVYKKSSGCIFSIFSSKSEAVCRSVQMHSGRSLLARFAVKSCGHNFTICASKN